MRTLILAVPIALAVAALAPGCKADSKVDDRFAEKGAERDEVGKAAIKSLMDKYVETLVSTLPPAAVKPVEGKPSPMLEWRRNAAKFDMKALAEQKAAELGDTEAATILRDGALVFGAVGDFWLGRSLQGPALKQEWEEGYQESQRVAARQGAREVIPLPAHVAAMKELGSRPEWQPVADFEILLPHLIQLYQYRTYPLFAQGTSFSRVWQVMFDLPRKREADGPESYQPYRDRLCKDKLGDACKVPYEHRDVMVRRAYVERVIAQVEAFRKAHPDVGLEPVLQRFAADLARELREAILPEEYPVLPDTLAWTWSSPYTVLAVGPKGITLETDNPEDRHERLTKELMGARVDWALDEETATALVDKLVAEIRELADAGAGPDYTTQLLYHFDKSVPVQLLATLSRALKPAGVKLVDFVGRRRADDSLRIRRVPGTAVDEEARVPIDLAGPAGEAWKCLPVASLGDGNIIPSMAKHWVLATGAQVRAGTAGKVAASADLGGDLTPLVSWLKETDKITLVGVKGTLTTQQLHSIIGRLAYRCPDLGSECEGAQLVDKLLLAICD